MTKYHFEFNDKERDAIVGAATKMVAARIAPREYLSKAEAADYLGFASAKAFDEWHRRERPFPIYHVSRFARYRLAELRAWLEAQQGAAWR